MSRRGESYLVGLIGDGITASLTPPLHEEEADLHGLRYLYRPVDLSRIGAGPDDAPALMRAGFDLGFSAFNITHPAKQIVIPHLDHVAPDAAELGAVNTVLLRDGRTEGHNTDLTGFASALREGLPGADLGAVVQLGVGGAGAATAHALLAAGASELRLHDLDPARAAARAAELGERFPAARVVPLTPAELPEALSTADGLVNASPIGMHIHPGAPVDLGLLHPGLWVADIIYLPQETELIRRARQLGCPVLPGGHMLVGQAVDAFELITGIRPDPARMRRRFERLVGAQQGAGAA
jgi:shikimate dehydrogenase